MLKFLGNCAFTVLAIAVYNHFKIDEIGQPIAVANYDAVYTAFGSSADKEAVNRAVEALQADSAKLVGAGYVVIDSRALIGYPVNAEVPISPAMAAGEVTSQDAELKGSEIKGADFDEK